MTRASWLIALAVLAWACEAPAPHRPQPPTTPPSVGGPSTSPGRPCGGASATPCPGTQVCDPDPGQCGNPGAPGHCVPRAKACTKIYQPVCGCDGTTYGNECMRVAAGAQKASPGECRKR